VETIWANQRVEILLLSMVGLVALLELPALRLLS
jgi:hypothetical protein